MPLITSTGIAIGTPCVLDKQPRNPSKQQIEALKILARQVVNLMDLRKKTKEMEIAEIRLKASEANYKLLFESNPLPKILLDIETLEILEVNVAAEEKYGYAKSDLKGKNMGVLNLPDKRITLKGNQNALYRLFLNLTSNALKFILENRTPEVTINCEDQNSKWQFSVSDNGIGIDKDYLPTLFEPFNRINDKQTEGTGLGLATCKKIVDQHGGKIWVDSIPGKGSQFFLLCQRSLSIAPVNLIFCTFAPFKKIITWFS